MGDVFDAVVNERIKAAERERDETRRFRDHAELCFWQDAVIAALDPATNHGWALKAADDLVQARRERLIGMPLEVRVVGRRE